MLESQLIAKGAAAQTLQKPLESFGMKTFLRKYTPRAALISLKDKALDIADAARGRLVPPRRMRSSVGDTDFLQTGYEFLAHFQNHGGLRPEHRVLDAGCGIGRLAIPLTTYLSKSGSYEGFDIVRPSIKWCSENITPRYPNFRFQHANIWNKMYNPDGQLKAADFRFPYDNREFDFVFLTSVFTHMLRRDVNQYFSEISRVLRPGGRCLITWFLLNNESKRLIENGMSSLQFAYPIEDCLTIDPAVPEEAIAYKESDVLEMYQRHGIKLIRPIHYGAWCGRTDYLSYQDICVGRKV